MSNEYREGQDPTVTETVGKASDEYEDEIREIPLTAFLVLQFKDRTDLVREVPGMKVDHTASMQEIRNTCTAIAADAQSTLTTMKFTESLAKAAEARERQGKNKKSRLVVPGRR